MRGVWVVCCERAFGGVFEWYGLVSMHSKVRLMGQSQTGLLGHDSWREERVVNVVVSLLFALLVNLLVGRIHSQILAWDFSGTFRIALLVGLHICVTRSVLRLAERASKSLEAATMNPEPTCS